MKITNENYISVIASLDEVMNKGHFRNARIAVRKMLADFPNGVYGALRSSSPGFCNYVAANYSGRGFKEKLNEFLRGDK